MLFQCVENKRVCAEDNTRRVDVFNANKPAAMVSARIDEAGYGGQQRAKMQGSRWRRRKTSGIGHKCSLPLVSKPSAA